MKNEKGRRGKGGMKGTNEGDYTREKKEDENNINVFNFQFLSFDITSTSIPVLFFDPCVSYLLFLYM